MRLCVYFHYVCRYRAGGDGEKLVLFSAPDLQSSLGTTTSHGQAHDAMRKRLAPVRALQLAAKTARLLLAGSVEAGEEAALDLVREKEAAGGDYKAPPPRGGGGQAYAAPPPSPRFMVRAGGGSGGARQFAVGK